jgi:hypothetical protein
VGKPETPRRERAAEMARIVKVPITGANVKKGINWVKNAEGKAVVAPYPGPGPGRPPKHDLTVVIEKSIAIIQTIGANKREMYLVAAAYFDGEFVAHKEGERVRLQTLCREMGRKARNSKQENYKGLLDRCKLEYRWLVDAARMTPEGRLMYFVYCLLTEQVGRKTT